MMRLWGRIPGSAGPIFLWTWWFVLLGFEMARRFGGLTSKGSGAREECSGQAVGERIGRTKAAAGLAFVAPQKVCRMVPQIWLLGQG